MDFVGLTTLNHFTVCIIHPLQQAPMVNEVLEKSGGFRVEHMVWAQTTGILSKANLPFQSRVLFQSNLNKYLIFMICFLVCSNNLWILQPSKGIGGDSAARV